MTEVQHNSEMNMHASQPHLECEERYKRLEAVVSEMEQKFNTKIKELEKCLEIQKTELERLNIQIHSNGEIKSHSHVMIQKQIICYCYAQIGAPPFFHSLSLHCIKI